ncbi:hypothetical protein GQ55_7G023800 [Panicum hallii var. hallii]|uniref:Uncharacterized protein n=1 Tax=Panicum hallii var. hallii TaxID=1504633 RepID=A0A2T7CS18_9POAL|nr:hypothetical protein GQ55_7G023800 [Panicum hallii var. hallii]
MPRLNGGEQAIANKEDDLLRLIPREASGIKTSCGPDWPCAAAAAGPVPPAFITPSPPSPPPPSGINTGRFRTSPPLGGCGEIIFMYGCTKVFEALLQNTKCGPIFRK